MATKSRPTLDQHAELGRTLAGLRDELQHRVTQLRNAYPQTGPEALPARKLTEACKAIDEARDLLENALYREHPQEAATHVYYPQLQHRAIVTDLVAGGAPDCPATGQTTVDAVPVRVICNLPPHDGHEHHDIVHGDWTSADTTRTGQ